MAFSKARRLSDFIAADGSIPTGKFASSTITSAHLVDGTIAHADLHTNMDLTGKTVLVANASTGDSDTTAANTAFVQQEIAALVDSSPSALNTLNELAAALGDDANFSTTVTNSIATKLPLAGGTMTGDTRLNDSVKHKYGSGDYFQVYHDGSNGYLKNTSGWLNMPQGGSGVSIANSDFSESLAKFIVNGAVELYHNGGKKLETTSTGLTVTGSILAGDVNTTAGDVLLQGFYGSSGSTVTIGSERSSGGVVVGYGVQPSNTTQGQFLAATGNSLKHAAYVVADQHKWYSASSNTAVTIGSQVTTVTEAMRLTNNGRLGLGTENPATIFHIKATGSTSSVNEFLRIENSAGGGAAAGSSINFHHYHAGGGPAGGAKAASITAQNMDSWSAGTPSGYSSGLTFGTLHENTFDERMRINSEGKVGIGINPAITLHAYHPTTNVVARFESGDNQVWIDLHDDGSGTYGALLGHDSDAGILFRVADASVNDKLILDPSGNLTIAGRIELISANNYIVADQSTATKMTTYLNGTLAGEWKRTGSGGSIRPNQYSSGNTSANLPALASYDDEDTGVFFPEADKVGFAAGGNNIFTVKNTGQIEARGEVTGTRIVASVQDMFNMGSEKSEHPMITGTGRTYVDGGSSNYQGYRFATENFFPPVFIPYSPNQVYRVSASIYQLQGSTASGGASARHYFGLAGYDENFNFLSVDGIGTYQYILGSNFTLGTGSTQEMDVTMKGWNGSGGTNGNKMDQGTVYIRPLALINYQSAGGLAVLTGFTVMPAGTVADNDSNAGTNY